MNGLSARCSGGMILVTESRDNLVAEFNLNGNSINNSFITFLSAPVGIVMSNSNLFIANSANGTIGEYSLAGAVNQRSLISGLNAPRGLAVDGDNLFVATAGAISSYATAGTPLWSNPLNFPTGVCVWGPTVFVCNWTSTGDAAPGTIEEFTTSGQAIAAPFISGLNSPTGIVTDGAHIFISEYDIGTIAEYTIDGALVNPSFITGLSGPAGIALSPDGTDLLVANFTSGTVGEYTITGQTINASLIKNLSYPRYIVVLPEPAIPACLGAPLLWGISRRTRKSI